MSAAIHPSHWNWIEISAIATCVLAIGTFWMAIGTRRLGREGRIQQDIASRSEYSLHQPIFIPIIPHRDTDSRTSQYTLTGGATIEKHVEASFFSNQPTNNVNIRIVLKNVGTGPGRIIQTPSSVLVNAAIGSGLEARADPNPLVVAPGDTVDIWAIGKPKMANLVMDTPSERGIAYYARIRFQYTDLSNLMITDCDILFDVAFEDELRPIDIFTTQPRPYDITIDGSL